MKNKIEGFNTDITATEFEILVKNYLVEIGGNLNDLKIQHNTKIESYDGNYQIDVYTEFEALNTKIKVLVECKKHKNFIKRETVQVLYDKIRATGSHKGIIFATSGFQSGAEKFAKEHGIALITIIDGKLTCSVKSFHKENLEEYLKFWDIPKFVGEYKNGSSICYLQKGYMEDLKYFIYD
ncbi:restriction endonuclease [Chryseobacterium sp. 18068]|uniref:restriction endonuclease n=1 Tax=Chryseobacterium sp. 18068 TaxID=2681414 RepID=UPI00135B9CAA|nr:restriction endonuclease [Chryseobacterium sp. 18068]